MSHFYTGSSDYTNGGNGQKIFCMAYGTSAAICASFHKNWQWRPRWSVVTAKNTARPEQRERERERGRKAEYEWRWGGGVERNASIALLAGLNSSLRSFWCSHYKESESDERESESEEQKTKWQEEAKGSVRSVRRVRFGSDRWWQFDGQMCLARSFVIVSQHIWRTVWNKNLVCNNLQTSPVMVVVNSFCNDVMRTANGCVFSFACFVIRIVEIRFEDFMETAVIGIGLPWFAWKFAR